MLKARYRKYILKFKVPGGTSRGVLTEKETWLIDLYSTDFTEIVGCGEAALFKGLSYDDVDNYESVLSKVCEDPLKYIQNEELLIDFPSIQFGLEMAFQDLKNGGKGKFFNNSFSEGRTGIPINGLIWMGNKEYMMKQVREKLDQAYSCLKFKIGALDFDTEMDLLFEIRKKYSKTELEIRVDANGAFSYDEALERLSQLAKLSIHSIEQPIAKAQFDEMKQLCAKEIIPIALDEELIGVIDNEKKIKLLDYIKPQAIVLKPSLLGGFKKTEEWINLAKVRNINWWITSALESNIGLNAIAQWTSALNVNKPQGLGTGQLFENNIDSDLIIRKGELWLKGGG